MASLLPPLIRLRLSLLCLPPLLRLLCLLLRRLPPLLHLLRLLPLLLRLLSLAPGPLHILSRQLPIYQFLHYVVTGVLAPPIGLNRDGGPVRRALGDQLRLRWLRLA